MALAHLQRRPDFRDGLHAAASVGMANNNAQGGNNRRATDAAPWSLNKRTGGNRIVVGSVLTSESNAMFCASFDTATAFRFCLFVVIKCAAVFNQALIKILRQQTGLH